VPFTVFSSPVELGITLAVFVLAYTIYTLFGFGSGLIAVGLLALVLPVQDVAVLVLLINFPLELMILLRARRDVPWRSVGFTLLGVLPMVPVGGYLLSSAPPQLALFFLGVFLVIAGAAFLLLQREQLFARKAWAEPLVGGAAGLLGGMFGTSGPPLILYFQAVGFDKREFRFALLAIFHAITWLRLVTYVATGLITAPRLVSALEVFPALVVGAFLGTWLHVSITERTFRRLVSVALVVLGLLLVAGG
jgi:uncharacterized membrane protein YfcA